MAPSEQGILRRLLETVRELCRRALEVVRQAWGSATVPPDPGRIWVLELWWTHLTDELVSEGVVSPGVGAALRDALGRLAEQLAQVVADGGDQVQAEAEVARFLAGWEGWARRVAVTESTRLASEAILGSDAARSPGAMKEWKTELDSRVRKSHKDVEGVRVPVDGVWYVDGWPMRFPGDPLGPPEQTLGCRCRPKIVGRATP
jgi:hypothetical protein